MSVRPEDAAAGVLRCFPEGVRRGCAGGGLDPQRGSHRAFAYGRAHSRRMGRRLRKSRLMRFRGTRSAPLCRDTNANFDLGRETKYWTARSPRRINRLDLPDLPMVRA